MIYPQLLLDTHEELIIDLFAGGGGASLGIEMATGRQVDVAINHDAAAIQMHKANHPQTLHLRSDVFEVDPRLVCQGRKVGLLWASPDCTYHSKARGSKPIRSATKKRRALAWVVTRWAGQVRPRLIHLENVEEFAQWGPLRGKTDQLRPCAKRRGKTFKRWVKSLTDMGYAVEWRELRACDYGTPTIRKRLFVIARCDGKPIVWPEITHGAPESAGVKSRRLKPFRAAAECIDWSLPMCSVFATKDEAKEWGRVHGQSAPIRPLADKTMQRIARGVDKFVLKNPKPFLVTVAHGEGSGESKRWGDGTRDIDNPLTTATTKNAHAVVAPFLSNVANSQTTGRGPNVWTTDEPLRTVPSSPGFSLAAACLSTYYGGPGSAERGSMVDEPVDTITSGGNRHALSMAFLAQNNGGFFEGAGRGIDEPLSTVLVNSRGHHGLMAAHIQRDFGTSTGSSAEAPIGTITSDYGGHAALVGTFMTKYYGEGIGQKLDEPIHTIPTVDRFGLVSVMIGGEPFVVYDIGMRMLQPKELYAAQGFHPGYIIDRGADGRTLTKTEQVRMCGNSVCPPVAAAIVRANAPELVARTQKEMIKAGAA